jgi:HEAT repeat protein
MRSGRPSWKSLRAASYALFLALPTAEAQAQLLAAETPTRAPGALSEQFGLEEGRAGLFSLNARERHRAVDRLVTVGTPEAINALLEALESGSPLSRDSAGRLRLVRGLAAFAEREEVRAYLAREMLDAGGKRDTTNSLSTMVRETAALALAARGDEPALRLLISAALLRGAAGDPARMALLAYPPRRLTGLLFEENEFEPSKPPATVMLTAKADKPLKPEKSTKPALDAEPSCEGDECNLELGPTSRSLNPTVVSFLGDLGDVRSIPALRLELDRTDRAQRAAAAIALAKLGDGISLNVIRGWEETSDPRLVLAAGEALDLAGDAEAARFVKAALSHAEVRSRALELAGNVGSPSLCKSLAELKDLTQGEQVRRTMAFARCGCFEPVTKAVLDPVVGPAAITALGTSAKPEAEQAIEAALARLKDAATFDAEGRAWLRAAVMQSIARGEAADGLPALLESALRSKYPEDIELGALGLVALKLHPLKEVLVTQAADAALFGAARGALVSGPEDRTALAQLFASVDPEAPSLRHLAAGVALLEGGAEVPQLTLFRLAENGGALASLAASALGARIGEAERERLRALLTSGDPSIRASVAFGLRDCQVKAATSWLAQAYRSEEEPMVRAAIVTALRARKEVQGKSVLRLAATLDPDSRVRALARSTAQHAPLFNFIGMEPGLAALTQISVAGNQGAVGLSLLLPSGIALPVVSSVDGALLLPGVPFGRSTVRLAAQAKPVEPR